MISRDQLEHAAAPGLGRRLAAICYDLLLVLGILLVAAAPLPAIPEATRQLWWCMLLIRIYLLGVIFLFFGWFWVHGGQTLGMRAWRLRVVRHCGGELTWRHAGRRFLAAALSWLSGGIGFLWCLVDRRKFTWHDHLSGTRLVLLAKRQPAVSNDSP